ncbi:hypothetical protein C8R45DRAFT_937002 [Mycena sanguinolenta]|nr:hypothetical protein C8R45DRAFT_937002 [Mycena sanguinolenta]
MCAAVAGRRRGAGVSPVARNESIEDGPQSCTSWDSDEEGNKYLSRTRRRPDGRRRCGSGRAVRRVDANEAADDAYGRGDVGFTVEQRGRRERRFDATTGHQGGVPDGAIF